MKLSLLASFLFGALVAFKIDGTLAWSWWVVLSPIWFSAAVLGVIALVVAVLLVLVASDDAQ